jgi:CRISPR system Cascade subunit CasD
MTERAPTKSGIIGLAASALGYKRDDPINELQQLKFAARVDQPGKIIKDFHTAHTFEEKKKQLSFISDRYYLSDAIFIVGLEGPRELLATIEKALQNPVFPIFLGRRSCPPSIPLVLGIREKPLMEALLNAPWEASERHKRNQPTGVWLEIVRDAEPGELGGFDMRDFPITFSQSHRQHVFRNVISNVRAVEIKNESSWAYTSKEYFDAGATKHDPFDELEADYVSVQD